MPARKGRKRTGTPKQWRGRVQVSALITPQARDELLVLADAHATSMAHLIRRGIVREMDALEERDLVAVMDNDGEEVQLDHSEVAVNTTDDKEEGDGL
jgi:hypothetical protein